MVMEVSEQELISETTGSETAVAPVQPEGEVGQQEFVGEAPEAPEATGEDEEKMEEEQGTQQEEVAEADEEQHDDLHENQEEDEGFELGGEEEGYVVQDEISEAGLHAELEDEGLEVAEEEKNDEWLLHPGNYFSSDQKIPNYNFFFYHQFTPSSVEFTCLYYLDDEGKV